MGVLLARERKVTPQPTHLGREPKVDVQIVRDLGLTFG